MITIEESKILDQHRTHSVHDCRSDPLTIPLQGLSVEILLTMQISKNFNINFSLILGGTCFFFNFSNKFEIAACYPAFFTKFVENLSL